MDLPEKKVAQKKECLWEKMLNKLRLLNIQKRLLLLVALLVGFISIVTVMAWRFSSSSLLRSVDSLIEQNIHSSSFRISDLLEELERHSMSTVYSSKIQNILKRRKYMTDYQWHVAKKEISSLVEQQYFATSSVTDVLIITAEGERIVCYGRTDFPLRINEKILQELEEKLDYSERLSILLPAGNDFEDRLVSVKTPVRKPGFVLCRKIFSLKEEKELGILIIKVSDSSILELYSANRENDQFYSCIVNQENKVISTDFKELEIGQLFFLQEENNAEKQKITRYQEETYAYYSQPIAQSDWSLITLVSMKYLNESPNQLMKMILCIGIGVSGIALVIALALTQSILVPLRSLQEAIAGSIRNNFQSKVRDPGADEIGKLADMYDMMTEQLQSSIKDMLQKEQAKRDAEIRMLRYQINPHFLSNSLRTIEYLAELQEAHNIEHMAHALNSLMIASCGKIRDLIPLDEEIQFLENYIFIQKFRFLDSVNYQYEIASNCRYCLVPSFILQPMVENALTHGFTEGKTEGEIRIRTFRENDRLVIQIHDNGVGMTAQQIEQALHLAKQPTENAMNRIGLVNIKERIILMFGEKYGLSLASEPGQGTEVRIILPYMEETTDEKRTVSG